MHSSNVSKEWRSRLIKIEGQVRGIRNMVETNRSSAELITQIASAKSALHQLAVKIFEVYLYEELPLLVSGDGYEPSEKQIKEMLMIMSRSFK